MSNAKPDLTCACCKIRARLVSRYHALARDCLLVRVTGEIQRRNAESFKFLFNLLLTRLRVCQVNLEIFNLPRPTCQITYLTRTASITSAVISNEFTDSDVQMRLIKDVK